MIGTNYLSHLRPETIWSHIEDFVSSVGTNLAVCEVLNRKLRYQQAFDVAFNVQADILRQYLSVVLEPLPYTFI